MDGGTHPGAGPPEPVLANWERVRADVEATAEEYREAGWRAVELTPGEVTPLPPEGGPDRHGLEVLVPDDDLDAVAELAAEAEFDASEVYRTYVDGYVFALVAVESSAERAAVLFPVYYDLEAARPTLERALRRGHVETHLRNLADDRRITFEHDEPELFFPESDTEG